MSTAGIYGAGSGFPAGPRMKGIAAVTAGPSAPATSEARTVVYFRTKEEIDAASASASPLAAKDSAAEGPASVRYETIDGKEARVVTVSIGPAAKVDASGLRKAASAAIGKLRALKVASAEIVLPTVAGVSEATSAAVLVQAAVLTNYAFDRYLTAADKVPHFVSALHFTASDASAVAAAQQTAALCDCTIFARDLATERADEMSPEHLEAVAGAIAAETGATLTVVKGEDLIKHGLHLMAAVGQSSRHGPRYIELVHKGDPAHPDDVLMVVGKGITFDTGGLNIKGTGFMEDMHMDKGGASAALGCALAAGRLNIKRNVVFVAAVAENSIDSLSYKPKAIIKSLKGLTVEIGNTDAEGRLVLADALTFGQMRNKPHTVIDMATLTGACIIGLGEYAAGLFTNNGALRAGLQAAADAR
jgi:leucyl aminopeptidase